MIVLHVSRVVSRSFARITVCGKSSSIHVANCSANQRLTIRAHTDKQKMADSIIGNDENWLTKLDNKAFKELITLNKQSIMED